MVILDPRTLTSTEVELLAVPDHRGCRPTGRRTRWRFCGDNNYRAELADLELKNYAMERFEVARQAYGWRIDATSIIQVETVTTRGHGRGQCPWRRARLPHRHVVVSFVNLDDTIAADQWTLVRDENDVDLSELRRQIAERAEPMFAAGR